MHRYAIERTRRKILISAQVAGARDRLEATLRTAAEVVDALDVDVAAEEASERAAADARIEEERSEQEAAERAAAARRLDAERAQQADEAARHVPLVERLVE